MLRRKVSFDKRFVVSFQLKYFIEDCKITILNFNETTIEQKRC